jgi:hypothetical protein
MKSQEARWSLVFWLLPAAGLVGYSAWCVADGWFRSVYTSQLFNQVMAPVSLAAALWCARQGIKEYRKVQAEEKKKENSSGEPPEDGREG